MWGAGWLQDGPQPVLYSVRCTEDTPASWEVKSGRTLQDLARVSLDPHGPATASGMSASLASAGLRLPLGE